MVTIDSPKSAKNDLAGQLPLLHGAIVRPLNACYHANMETSEDNGVVFLRCPDCLYGLAMARSEWDKLHDNG